MYDISTGIANITQLVWYWYIMLRQLALTLAAATVGLIQHLHLCHFSVFYISMCSYILWEVK